MPAWQAWDALCDSKERYFSKISELEGRRREGGGATLAEQLHLEQLLREHTACTGKFRDAVTALSNQDPDAHGQLVRCLRE